MSQNDLDVLDSETLDDLLNAEIDGELDAALVELAPTVSAAEFRLWVEATPRATTRADALRHAADLLRADAVQPTDLDEMSRHRLVAAALAEVDGIGSPGPARQRHPSASWARRAYLGVGSVAAGALIIAGVAATLHSNRAAQPQATKQAFSTTTSARPEAAGNSTNTVPSPAAADVSAAELPDIGAISSLADISATRLTERSNATATKETTTVPQANGAGAATSTTIGARNTDGAPKSYSTTTRCLAALPGASGAPDVHNIAVATVNGVRAVVARGSTPQRTLTWVYRPSDCVVLLSDGP